MPMLEEQEFNTFDIYVPARLWRTLDPKMVEQIAESMIDEGRRAPIMVGEDGSR